MRAEIEKETKDIETKQKQIEAFIVLIYQLTKIVELMRSHNEKIYRNNQPNMLQQRVKNARDYKIKLWNSYKATDDIN